MAALPQTLPVPDLPGAYSEAQAKARAKAPASALGIASELNAARSSNRGAKLGPQTVRDSFFSLSGRPTLWFTDTLHNEYEYGRVARRKAIVKVGAGEAATEDAETAEAPDESPYAGIDIEQLWGLPENVLELPLHPPLMDTLRSRRLKEMAHEIQADVAAFHPWADSLTNLLELLLGDRPSDNGRFASSLPEELLSTARRLVLDNLSAASAYENACLDIYAGLMKTHMQKKYLVKALFRNRATKRKARLLINPATVPYPPNKHEYFFFPYGTALSPTTATAAASANDAAVLVGSGLSVADYVDVGLAGRGAADAPANPAATFDAPAVADAPAVSQPRVPTTSQKPAASSSSAAAAPPPPWGLSAATARSAKLPSRPGDTGPTPYSGTSATMATAPASYPVYTAGYSVGSTVPPVTAVPQVSAPEQQQFVYAYRPSSVEMGHVQVPYGVPGATVGVTHAVTMDSAAMAYGSSPGAPYYAAAVRGPSDGAYSVAPQHPLHQQQQQQQRYHNAAPGNIASFLYR